MSLLNGRRNFGRRRRNPSISNDSLFGIFALRTEVSKTDRRRGETAFRSKIGRFEKPFPKTASAYLSSLKRHATFVRHVNLGEVCFRVQTNLRSRQLGD